MGRIIFKEVLELKIKIAYSDADASNAKKLVDLIKSIFNIAQIKSTDKKPPYRHYYITTKDK